MCTHSNGKDFNFYKFANLNLFRNKNFNGKTSIDDALEEQAKMEKLLISLKKYNPSNDYEIKTRKEILKNAEDLFGQEIRLLMHLEMVFSYLLKMCKKNKLKK